LKHDANLAYRVLGREDAKYQVKRMRDLGCGLIDIAINNVGAK
jgi:hypothetical protein